MIYRSSQVVRETMIWQQGNDGTWERHLMRLQANGKLDWNKLHRVWASSPMCLACLSVEVVRVHSAAYPDGQIACHSCGARIGIV
jgi:hypothetical protein